MRKAFDSVHRELLLQKLKDKYCISDFWLMDYLSDRFQYVSHEKTVSASHKTYIGVPQGSVLGPKLFSLYINDLPEVVQFSLPELFADDSNFVFVWFIDDFGSLNASIETDMHAIVDWTVKNQIQLNKNKTKVLCVGSKRNLKHIEGFSVKFDNNVILPVTELKCLGLIFDCELNWSTHINSMTKICYYRLRTLYSIKDFVSMNQLQVIGEAMIMSILNYMCSIWGALPKNT